MASDVGAVEFEVEKIVRQRNNKGVTLYRVRWVGYGPESDTWEPVENLVSCKELLDAFHERRRRNSERKLDALNKSKSKKQKSKRKFCLLLSSSDEEADTVKDKFWDLLEKGQIPLPEHDLYTNVKSCSRTSLPLSLNECAYSNDSSTECSDWEETKDGSCCGQFHGTAKKERRRRKCHRSTSSLSVAESHSKPKVPHISRKDGMDSTSTASADDINLFPDNLPSLDANNSTTCSKPGHHVPSRDPRIKKSTAFLSTDEHGRNLEHQNRDQDRPKKKSSSRSHSEPKHKHSERSHRDWLLDLGLDNLTITSTDSPKGKHLPGPEPMESLNVKSDNCLLNSSQPKMEKGRKGLPVFTGNKLEFVDDTDASDSTTEGGTAAVTHAKDAEMTHVDSVMSLHCDRHGDNKSVEMDQETGLFKRPKVTGETGLSDDQRRQKKKSFLGGDGEGKKGKHMIEKSSCEEMPRLLPHWCELDQHRKSRADDKMRWIVDKPKSCHSSPNSEATPTRLVFKCVGKSEKKHVHVDPANRPNEVKHSSETTSARNKSLPVGQSKHGKSDLKIKSKHSSGDGVMIRKPVHHASDVSSSLTLSSKTDNKDLHIKSSFNRMKSSSDRDHARPSSSHDSIREAVDKNLAKPSSCQGSITKQAVDKDHAKPSSSQGSITKKAVDKNHAKPSSCQGSMKQAVDKNSAKMLVIMQPLKHDDKVKDAENREDIGQRKDAHGRKDAERRQDGKDRRDVDKGKDRERLRKNTEKGKNVEIREDSEKRKYSDKTIRISERKDSYGERRKDDDNRKDAAQKNATDRTLKTSERKDCADEKRKDAEIRKDADQTQDAEETMRIPERKECDIGNNTERGMDIESGKDVNETLDADETMIIAERSECYIGVDAQKRLDMESRKDDNQTQDPDDTIRVSQNVSRVPILSSETITRNETLEKNTDVVFKDSVCTESDKYKQPKLLSIRKYRIPKKSAALVDNMNSISSSISSRREALPIRSEAVCEEINLTEFDRCLDLSEYDKCQQRNLLRVQKNCADQTSKSGASLKRNFDETDSLELDDPRSKRFCTEILTRCFDSVTKEVSVKVGEHSTQPLPNNKIPSLRSIALVAKSKIECAVRGIKTEDNAQTLLHDTVTSIRSEEDILLAEIVQRDELQTAIPPDKNALKDTAIINNEPNVALLQDFGKKVAGDDVRKVQYVGLEMDMAGSIVEANDQSTDTAESEDRLRTQSLRTFMPATTQHESTAISVLPWIKLENNVDAEVLEMVLWKDTENKRQIDAVALGVGTVKEDQHEYRIAERSGVGSNLVAEMDINDCINNVDHVSYFECKREIISEGCSKEQASAEMRPLCQEVQKRISSVGEVDKDGLRCRNRSQSSMDSLDEKKSSLEKLDEFHELLEELFLDSNLNSLAQGDAPALQTRRGEDSNKEFDEFVAGVCERVESQKDKESIVCKTEMAESSETDNHTSTDEIAEPSQTRNLRGNTCSDVQEKDSHSKGLSKDNLIEGIAETVREHLDVLEIGRTQESVLQLGTAEYEQNCFPDAIGYSGAYEAGEVEENLDFCIGTVYVNKDDGRIGENVVDSNSSGNLVIGDALSDSASSIASVTDTFLKEDSCLKTSDILKIPVKDNLACVRTSGKQNLTVHDSPVQDNVTLLKTPETGKKGILKTSVKKNLAVLEGHVGKGLGEMCQNDVLEMQDNLTDRNVCETNRDLCDRETRPVVLVNEGATSVMHCDVRAELRPSRVPAVIRLVSIDKESGEGLSKHWTPERDANVEMEIERLDQEIGTEMLLKNLSEKEVDSGCMAGKRCVFAKPLEARHSLFDISGTALKHSDMTAGKAAKKSPPKTQEKPVQKFSSVNSQDTIRPVPLAGKQVQQGESLKKSAESAYTLRETLKEKFMEDVTRDGIQGLRSIMKKTGLQEAKSKGSPNKPSVSSKKDLNNQEIGLENMSTSVDSSPGNSRFAWNSEGTLNSPAVPSSPSCGALDFGNILSNIESSSPARNSTSRSTDRGHVEFSVAALGLDINQLPKAVPRSLITFSNEDMGRAVFANEVKVVQFAFEREGVIWDLEQRDESGQTLVMAAASYGNNFMLRLLVLRGALVNSKKADGTTALMIAAQKGFARTVEFLLDFSARIDDRTCSGETALIKAARQGHDKIVNKLLDHGANFSPTVVGDVTIFEVIKSNELIRTATLLHIHCLETDFDCRASAAIRGGAIIVRPLFPLQCLTVRDTECFSMSFNYESSQPYSNSFGAMLFIGHAFINYQSIRCLLKMNSYAVKNVTLNAHQQKCVERGEPFCWTLVPLCQGINHVKVQLKHCTDRKMKLVMRGYQVMSSDP